MTEKKQLTVNDPVSSADLTELEDLSSAWYKTAGALLELEQEKVSLMVMAKTIKENRVKLFERLLTERGLSPRTVIDVDPATGLIEVRGP